MARSLLAHGARYNAAVGGREARAPAQPKPRKRGIGGGEAALLERIGEQPRRSRGSGTRPPRELTIHQRWF
jgi:hypothetical protein